MIFGPLIEKTRAMGAMANLSKVDVWWCYINILSALGSESPTSFFPVLQENLHEADLPMQNNGETNHVKES